MQLKVTTLSLSQRPGAEESPAPKRGTGFMSLGEPRSQRGEMIQPEMPSACQTVLLQSFVQLGVVLVTSCKYIYSSHS